MLQNSKFCMHTDYIQIFQELRNWNDLYPQDKQKYFIENPKYYRYIAQT